MTYAIQGSLQRAIEYSKEFELQNIEIEAILKATLNENESLIKSVLERANIDVEELEKAYDNKLKAYPTVQGDNGQYGQYISAKANELMNKSETYMNEYDDEFISMEHVLRAAMDIDQTTQNFIGNKTEVVKEIINKIRAVSYTHL